MLALGLTIVLASTGAIVPSRPALGASTTVTIISGEVEVRHAGFTYAAAADGELLQAGDAVRTGPDGRAVLTYFEGSTVEIEPVSEIVIDAASIEPDASTAIVMTQTLGHTWHVVTRQLGPSSRYEVSTPAATAAVRGTAFEVIVQSDEAGELVSSVVTTEGTVAFGRDRGFAQPREEVLVSAGSQAEARRGRTIEAPRPRPEPAKVVTVTIGSERSIVVDALGRANGFRDGKLVIQTPGATVRRVDGKLVITLPNAPDGRMAAHVEGDEADDEVEVETTVRERGNAATASERVVPGGARASVDLEVRGGERPEVRARAERGRPTPTPTATATLPGVPLPSVPTFAPERSRAPERTEDTDRGGRATTSPSRAVPSFTLPTPPVLRSDPSRSPGR